MRSMRNVVVFAVAMLAVGCAQKKGLEQNPDLAAIEQHLDAYLEAYPNAADGASKTCLEMKIHFVSATTSGALDASVGRRDLASEPGPLKAGEAVFFDGVATQFGRTVRVNGDSLSVGTVNVGASAYEVWSPNSSAVINRRIAEGQLVTGGRESPMFGTRGVPVCGFGIATVGGRLNHILLADMIESGAPLEQEAPASGIAASAAADVAEVAGEPPQEAPAAAGGTCEVIAKGEEEARSNCKSGNFAACRDIAGWVANKVMEGCAVTTRTPAEALHEECLSLAKSSLLANDYCMGGKGDQSACEFLGKAAKEAAQKGCPSDVVAEARAQMRRDRGEPAQAPATASAPAASASPSAEEASQPTRSRSEATVDATSKSMNPPRYPPAAFRAGIEGQVTLTVDVSADGAVTSVAIAKTSGNRDLDRAAMEAARKWRFNPAQENGVGMAGRVSVPVTFALN